MVLGFIRRPLEARRTRATPEEGGFIQARTGALTHTLRASRCIDYIDFGAVANFFCKYVAFSRPIIWNTFVDIDTFSVPDSKLTSSLRLAAGLVVVQPTRYIATTGGIVDTIRRRTGLA